MFLNSAKNCFGYSATYRCSPFLLTTFRSWDTPFPRLSFLLNFSVRWGDKNTGDSPMVHLCLLFLPVLFWGLWLTSFWGCQCTSRATLRPLATNFQSDHSRRSTKKSGKSVSSPGHYKTQKSCNFKNHLSGGADVGAAIFYTVKGRLIVYNAPSAYVISSFCTRDGPYHFISIHAVYMTRPQILLGSKSRSNILWELVHAREGSVDESLLDSEQRELESKYKHTGLVLFFQRHQHEAPTHPPPTINSPASNRNLNFMTL